MDKRFLEDCLARGMSLEAIGERTGKHPSTIGYWLKKHGLRAAGWDSHAPKGGIDEEQLTSLVAENLSLREMAERLDRDLEHHGVVLGQQHGAAGARSGGAFSG